jgi:hypothetical protein
MIFLLILSARCAAQDQDQEQDQEQEFECSGRLTLRASILAYAV